MRARTIKPGFFKNEELAEISPLGRILFAGIWCMADREGRLEDRPKRIKAEVLPYDDCSVNSILDELQARDFILRYSENGETFIQITNFRKHQHCHVREPESTIPAPGLHQSSTVLKRPSTIIPLPITEETHTSSEQNSDDAFCVPKSNCPHQEIINLYHQKLPSLPAVKEWTPKRQALLRSRWSEKEERQNLEWWESFFDTVAASDFLTGKVGTFRASLEWLVRPTNFIKVIEDNYKNRNGSGHHESRPLPKDPEAEARLLALYGES